MILHNDQQAVNPVPIYAKYSDLALLIYMEDCKMHFLLLVILCNK